MTIHPRGKKNNPAAGLAQDNPEVGLQVDEPSAYLTKAIRTSDFLVWLAVFQNAMLHRLKWRKVKRDIESAQLEHHVSMSRLPSDIAHLAASTRNLIRLSIKGLRKPVFISPKKSSAFLMYLRIARSQRQAKA